MADWSTSAAMPSSPALSATWAARTAGTSGSGMASPDSPMTLEAWSSADSARSGAPSSAVRIPSAVSEIATWDDVGYSTSGAAARMARARSTLSQHGQARGRERCCRAPLGLGEADVRVGALPEHPLPCPDGRRDVHHPGEIGVIGAGEQSVDEALGGADVSGGPRGLRPPAGEGGDVATGLDGGGVEPPRLDGLGGQRLVGLSAAAPPRPAGRGTRAGRARRPWRPAGRRRPRRRPPARAAWATARAPACSAGS